MSKIKKVKMATTIDQSEINHFAQDSLRWWDESGPFKPLHRLNPTRMDYIKRRICTHFSLDELDLKPFSGLSTLDIGCGGGLVCEPMARLGANTSGIDADAQAIDVAKAHADEMGLDITYLAGDAGALEQKYDVVTALEIAEHVSDLGAFMQICAGLLKPEGLLIMSTLNRTPKSYALGIIAAEYLLRWVPRGTHDWKKFIKPSELATHARSHGLEAHSLNGLIFNPLKNGFELSNKDFDVNYLICFKNPKS